MVKDKDKDKDVTQSLINYLNGLPKRSPMEILLPDGQSYSELEKAEMVKAGSVETTEEVKGGAS